MDWCRKFRKGKLLHFIHAVLMQWQNYTHIGSQSITVKRMECLLATEYYLIMKARSGVKPLLRVKSQGLSRQLVWECRIVHTSETLMHNVTGDMPKTMWKPCGVYCSRILQKIL